VGPRRPALLQIGRVLGSVMLRTGDAPGGGGPLAGATTEVQDLQARAALLTQQRADLRAALAQAEEVRATPHPPLPWAWRGPVLSVRMPLVAVGREGTIPFVGSGPVWGGNPSSAR